MDKQSTNALILDIKNLKTWFPIKRGILAKTVGNVRAVDGISIHILKIKVIKSSQYLRKILKILTNPLKF